MNKKKSILYIAINNLKYRKFRSIYMILFILIQSFTLFTSNFLIKSMEDSIDNVTRRMGADVIVIQDEYSEELKDSLFMGKPSTIYFDREWINKLDEISNISQISPQLYIQSMDSTCCDDPVQLIAIDSKTDFVIQPWLQDRKANLQQGEVIVGNNITSNIGETITFYDTKFKVIGKLDKNGTGYDNSVFMNFDTAYELKNSKVATENLKINDMENVISMILIDVEDDYSNERLAFDINTEFDDNNITAYTSNSLFSSVMDKVKQFSTYSTVLIVLIFVVTVMALIGIFVITINERKREIGILYSIGANTNQIIQMILYEGLIISSIGGIMGVLSSLGLITIFKNIISTLMEIPYLSTISLTSLYIGVVCIITSLLTGLVASTISVYKISKEETNVLIRENE